MRIAQQLYEGLELGGEGSVGLITYMRTDSTRVAEEALGTAREYIKTTYGTEYLPCPGCSLSEQKGGARRTRGNPADCAVASTGITETEPEQ